MRGIMRSSKSRAARHATFVLDEECKLWLQTFEKTGGFRFVACNHSLTEARMFGLAKCRSSITIQVRGSMKVGE